MNNNEEPVMHSKSDTMEIMIDEEADEVIEQLFQSLKNSCQNNSESKNQIVLDHLSILLIR